MPTRRCGDPHSAAHAPWLGFSALTEPTQPCHTAPPNPSNSQVPARSTRTTSSPAAPMARQQRAQWRCRCAPLKSTTARSVATELSDHCCVADNRAAATPRRTHAVLLPAFCCAVRSLHPMAPIWRRQGDAITACAHEPCCWWPMCAAKAMPPAATLLSRSH